LISSIEEDVQVESAQAHQAEKDKGNPAGSAGFFYSMFGKAWMEVLGKGLTEKIDNVF
jgi:hypothetical protein